MSDYCTQCGSAELHSRCDRDSPSASPDRLGLSYAWGVGEIVRSVPARYLCVKRRREAAAIANNAEPNRMMLDDSGTDDTGMSPGTGDRKSTRLNSSHGYISYAVFCLK